MPESESMQPNTILRAFSDARGLDPDLSRRSLRALGEPMTLEDWRQLMQIACPGGYNGFDADEVAADIARAAGRAWIVCLPAREYSPALYLYGEPAALERIARARTTADEVQMHPDGYDNAGDGRRVPGPCLRLWWD